MRVSYFLFSVQINSLCISTPGVMGEQKRRWEIENGYFEFLSKIWQLSGDCVFLSGLAIAGVLGKGSEVNTQLQN